MAVYCASGLDSFTQIIAVYCAAELLDKMLAKCTVHCCNFLWTTGAGSTYLAYSTRSPWAPVCVLTVQAVQAQCTGVCTHSIHFRCTVLFKCSNSVHCGCKLPHWLHLQCIRLGHNTTFIEIAVHIADAQCPDVQTHSVHSGSTVPWCAHRYCTVLLNNVAMC